MAGERMDHAGLEALAQRHGNSFYLFHPEVFAGNLEAISSAFRAYYDATIVAFALKANYMPELVRILHDAGHWCEVVSSMEYDIAGLYLPAERLIFNGPAKTGEDMRRALCDGAVLNLDSFHELELLRSLLDDFERIDVGVRVNFDIGLSPSRFGFTWENGEFSRAIDLLLETGKVRITGLHSHFTTRERSLDLFERRLAGMFAAYESLAQGDELEYFNIGGGFFGPMNDQLRKSQDIDPPRFEDYAGIIAAGMRDYFGRSGPRLVIEPGVSMVADSMDYVVRILDSRKARDREVLTVDGSINNLYPTGSRFAPSFEVVTREQGAARACDVAGNTCMEHDILLADCTLSGRPGDFIVFHNRGAYSNVYTPPFIQPAPPILGTGGEVFADRQSYLNVLSHYAH